jgi:hypothetical protein
VPATSEEYRGGPAARPRPRPGPRPRPAVLAWVLYALVLLLFATYPWLDRLVRDAGAAILRYRLYDLDRIISRTLAYGLLTVLLGAGYALVALVLGQLLGQDSSLVVAAATLAVAAVFQPARRRSRPRSTAVSTAAATTRPGSSRGSGPACATRSTWTP